MVKSEKLAWSGSAILTFKLFQNKLRGIQSHHTECMHGVVCANFLKLFLPQKVCLTPVWLFQWDL